ncbi:MAG: amidohydrolase [Chloroflexi bacterium]|nr:amidohydrolase [Chloroflexota bacterium]MBI3339385.1 amidohydrolase [Chloroflexota bacterium]
MLKQSYHIQEDIIEWRRDFHMHPELGFKEIRTSGRVAEELEKLGYRVRRNVGKTGVVADLGDDNGPCIAIRADMDALPILEANDTAYKSKNEGTMHACGHDSHTAMLLGVATLLVKEKFPGKVRLLFQPSEEAGDEEGISGAPRMIEDGAIQGVDMVLALHVDPATPVGTIRISDGPSSGGVDSWYGRIFGKGGHGAMPHEAIDPFHITSHVMMALNAIISRRLDPFSPAVVSVGTLNGGFTQNVIPAHVDISGTLRFTEMKVQKQIHEEIRRAFELSKVLGGSYELKFEIGAPPMINHTDAANLIEAVGIDLLGKDHVLPPLKGLGAEDFGAFSQIVPGAMFGLGTRIEGDERYLHHPRLDLDERALPIGTAILAESALRFLRNAK